MIIDISHVKRYITLTNIGLTHGFLTNIVSIQLLNEMEFYCSSRTLTRLEYEDYSSACFLYQDGGHILFHNPDPNPRKNTTLCARLAYVPDFGTIIEKNLHKVLAHPSLKILKHIYGHDSGINIKRSVLSPRKINCTTCCLVKASQIISRRTESEVPQDILLFHTLCWDATVIEEGYNGDK